MSFAPDIPRIYTAFAEWSACLVYILLLRRRRSGWSFWAVSALIFCIQAAFLMLTKPTILENLLGDKAIVFWIPCMAAAVGLMLAFFMVCCDITWQDAAFYTVRAFVLAEFSASLGWQLYLFQQQSHGSSRLFIYFGLLSSNALVCVAMYLLEKRHHQTQTPLNVQQRELFSTAVMGLVVFAISNMSFTSITTPFSAQYPTEILNIRTLVDLGGLAMLYAHHVQCRQVRAQREVESLQSVLQNQYVQYKLSRDSINVINRKHHDLKHQIAALRAEPDPDKRNSWLDGMEQEIKTYETQNKTGHPVLDTVLTGKSLYCQNHDIGLTCVADGSLLQFMDVMDLCTIFGNALDNAIECEKKISDKEKRLIHVTVAQQRDFVLLRFENYYEGELHFEAGLPRTTKRDMDFHGYGLKSIWHTAQKYGGNASLQTKNNWFELTVLIPMQNKI